jgi:prevent-host-death family protein
MPYVRRKTGAAMTTMTSREFNHDTARAKREAAHGPVIITDRGRPAHVLMSYEEYARLRGPRRTLAEALYDPATADIDLEIPPRTISRERPLDLTD